MKPMKLGNYINGDWVESKSTEFFEIRNPYTDELIALCPMPTPEEVDMAVRAAKEAFWDWRATPPPARARRMFKLRYKLGHAIEEIAEIIVKEHGKTYSDARAGLTRA